LTLTRLELDLQYPAPAFVAHRRHRRGFHRFSPHLPSFCQTRVQPAISENLIWTRVRMPAQVLRYRRYSIKETYP
jgi:hypothetical protein